MVASPNLGMFRMWDHCCRDIEPGLVFLRLMIRTASNMMFTPTYERIPRPLMTKGFGY